MVMKEGRAFVKFHEPEILFRCTYKYDIMRSNPMRRSKSGRHLHIRRDSKKRNTANESPFTIAEAVDEPDGTTQQNADDAASIVSSTWTTFTIPRSDAAQSDSDDAETSPSPPRSKPFAKFTSVWQAMSNTEKKASAPVEPPTNRRPAAKGASGVASSGRSKTMFDITRRLTRSQAQLNSSSSEDEYDDVTDEEYENQDYEKGVYDSSKKQRVPSWCDR